jgi:AsmA protein
MRFLLKSIAYIVGGVVVLVLLVGLAVTFLFDPNDYKDDIQTAVRDVTGREFMIEGDLGLTLFPWLAIETGRMTLGNAEGFGEEPFFGIEAASLSVRILPLIFGKELAIGTATLDGLRVNLAVDENGRGNWEDLVERQEQAEQIEVPDEEGASVTMSTDLEIDVAHVDISDAAFTFRDAQAGAAYSLDAVNLKTGRISLGSPIPVDGSFRFEAQPDNVSGQVDMAVEANVDLDTGEIRLDDFGLDALIEGATAAPAEIRLAMPAFLMNIEAETVAPGAIEFSVFDLDLTANVEPFSYAGTPTPEATVSVAAFSPRSLATALAVELPPTADPAALELVRLDARAVVSETKIALSDIVLVLDDTTLRGQLSAPRTEDGSYELDLAGDTIDLNRYMAPASEEEVVEAEPEETPPVEIPSELLRALNARGSLTFDEALMGPILFEDIQLVLNLQDGRLRLNPMSAQLFDGQYQGDVSVDASGDVPVLSVNERIENVSLAPLGSAMFERDNLNGRINGVFTLSGTGHDMSEVQRTLNGDVSYSLTDGAWEGTDVWYELRRARALIRQESMPEPPEQMRTRFSEVTATGKVVDGIMNVGDFRAELPFMQLTGSGTVNLVEATVDHSFRARILEKPELMGDVSQGEIDDLTKTVLPVKVTGSLSDPKFALDLESLARQRVEDEVKDRILDLLGDEEASDAENLDADGEPPEEEDVEDVLKRGLRDLIKKRD